MKLNTFLNQPFNYFDSHRNKWVYILSATFFAVIFLILFQPYGLSEEVSNPINSIKDISLFFLFVAISTFTTLAFSQFFARKWFGFKNVNIRKYMLWFFIEALLLKLVSFGFSFIFPDLGDDFENELNWIFQIELYFKALIVLIFPFIGSILYVLIKGLNSEINELEDQLNDYRKKFDSSQKSTLLNLMDENNNLDFSVALNDFLYAESSNQYLLIYYRNNGEVKKHIIRNRMKSFLGEIKNLPILQCHRSYAVNLLNVKHKYKKNGKNGLLLDTSEPIVVPISKSFIHDINKKLS